MTLTAVPLRSPAPSAARSASEEFPGSDQKSKDADEYPSPKDKDKDEGIQIKEEQCKLFQIIKQNKKEEEADQLEQELR